MQSDSLKLNALSDKQWEQLSWKFSYIEIHPCYLWVYMQKWFDAHLHYLSVLVQFWETRFCMDKHVYMHFKSLDM